MKDNKYKMLYLSELSYVDNLPTRQIITICNQIQADGFDPESEFDETTATAILSDYKYKKMNRKVIVQCVRQNCEKRVLRNNICRKHLLMDKKNVCNEISCRNLKYKFYSGPKKEELYDFCCFHRKRNRALCSLNTNSLDS